MTLRVRFNLILMLVTAAGLVAAALISYRVFAEHTREEVMESANILMESARAVRRYTVEEVRPLIAQLQEGEFHPQTVPAYAATRYVEHLQKKYPDYAYKEAALNPTNPVHRATDWEADIIEYFRGHPDARELVGERQTPTGPSLYFSRPIRITNAACLSCHSTPDQAPAAMVKKYGSVNGFGWKLDEVVGAQVVSVPQAGPLERARDKFLLFMAALIGIFILIALVLNWLLGRYVIRPVARMSAQAERISTGDTELEELPAEGNDEISSLARSFNRMQRSLDNAVQMLNETMQR
ncbi:Tll0287-like domain-containing protein [Thiohalobacter sp.]|uniref:Tll0287-like domain-containing protein n=1 Tax=Thiohalobacter sp. TaxID=2025948 RepID=UPI00262BE9ED|nr:DUF3365 domain-containing protein [Thiohalobacter sp.]